jgi:hypothetical protein
MLKESLAVYASANAAGDAWGSEGRKVSSFVFTDHLWYASNEGREVPYQIDHLGTLTSSGENRRVPWGYNVTPAEL